jgi:hypothetical protein
MNSQRVLAARFRRFGVFCCVPYCETLTAPAKALSTDCRVGVFFHVRKLFEAWGHLFESGVE